jgi:hypothetical protein
MANLFCTVSFVYRHQKAGLNFDLPKGKSSFGTDYTSVDEDAVRLDLDDLGGEICLLDWGYGGDSEPSVSLPNRSLQVNKLMGGSISVVLCHQNHNLNAGLKFSKRLVQLENNEFVKPLLNDSNDPVSVFCWLFCMVDLFCGL